MKLMIIAVYEDGHEEQLEYGSNPDPNFSNDSHFKNFVNEKTMRSNDPLEREYLFAFQGLHTKAPIKFINWKVINE
ncbi:MAG: hypothetical protein ACP5N7_04330 [Candidatus Pacearchaeota archaeon]